MGLDCLLPCPQGLLNGKSPGLGRSVIDRLGQLHSCLVLAVELLLILGVFFLLFSLPTEREGPKTTLRSAENRHWKSAWGLGLRPKVQTESLRLTHIVTQPSRVLHRGLGPQKA